MKPSQGRDVLTLFPGISSRLPASGLSGTDRTGEPAGFATFPAILSFIPNILLQFRSENLYTGEVQFSRLVSPASEVVYQISLHPGRRGALG
jgi:hypothetical protein